MLGPDLLGFSTDGLRLGAPRVIVSVYLVHQWLRLSLVDYGKCDPRPCRVVAVFAAHFTGRVSIIDDFA